MSATECVRLTLSDTATISRIDFTLCSFWVGPARFDEIFRLIDDGTIRVEHDPHLGDLAEGVPIYGVWDPNEDVLTLRFDRLSGNSSLNATQKGTIVHEIVHAMTDHYYARHMLVNTAEAAAYLAEYTLRRCKVPQGLRPHPSAALQHLIDVAWPIAGKVLGGHGHQLTHGEESQLRDAAGALYSGGNTRATHNGIQSRRLWGRGPRVMPAASTFTRPRPRP